MIISSLFRFDSDLVKVPKGNALFREGDAGSTMYVLVRGAADISVNSHLLEHAVSGSVVGELSVIVPGPRSATVTATSDCEFAEIDRERFHFLIGDNAHFAVEVMTIMARRLRQTDLMLA